VIPMKMTLMAIPQQATSRVNNRAQVFRLHCCYLTVANSNRRERCFV
jgi:hypothetical protein